MPTTPGLYRQPVAPVRAAARLSRGDVPVFLGYALRGPVGRPVRVESRTAFQELFGAPFPGGHLAQAVGGFFETGGQTAYVVRVSPPQARVAAVDLPDGVWRAEASFPWRPLDPRERGREATPEQASWVQVIEEVFRTDGSRSKDPGVWGNGYAVRVGSAERARTESVPGPEGDPRALVLRSLAGLETASVVRLAQTLSATRADGTSVTASFLTSVVPAAVDPAGQRLLLDRPVSSLTGVVAGQDELPPEQRIDPASFDLSRSIQVTSVEFDLEILAEGRLEQSFAALGPHPAHSSAIASVLDRSSRSVALVPVGPRVEVRSPEEERLFWADPAHWPTEGTHALEGGTDRLEEIRAKHYLSGLAHVKGLDEVALVAAPDLVLQEQGPPEAAQIPPEPVDCCDLSPPEPGTLRARVMEVDLDGNDRPLPGVVVDVTGPGGRTETGLDGFFRVDGVALGLVTVRFSKRGFATAEAVLQAFRFPPSAPVTLTMTRLRLPATVPDAGVLEVSQAMADPEVVGPYKVAVLDPPRPDATLDDVRSWRSRLGASSRMALFAPWLRLPAAGPGEAGALCPPSGHVCGAFAAAEDAFGIHRTGANLPLRYVHGVTLAIDGNEQGVLNPVGINAIRSFPGRGVRVFGTRTLSWEPEWTFLTTRRIADAIEKTLGRVLQWMVFEPNNLVTRHAVSQAAGVLLSRLWRDGVLAGGAPAAAYAVKCDEENNPPERRETGELVADIGFAPTTPYEFVVFRIGSAHQALTVTESAR